MNKKKISIIVVILTCIILCCFYRYERINKNIAKYYEKQEYHVGEDINLDNLLLSVKSYKIVQYNKGDNMDFFIKLQVKNTSREIIDGSPIVYNSKLAANFEYQDAADIENQDLNQLKILKPGDELNFTLRYSVLPGLKNKKDFKFYIANELYKNQIMKKYKNLKFYSKYVYLKN